MELNKIGVTLFDLLSFLLPGFVLVLALSIAEATFCTTSLFSLSALSTNWLTTSIAAYFLGQFSYRIGSLLQSRWPGLFKVKGQRLSDSLYYHVRGLLNDMHSIEYKEGERLRSLETYLLADSYLVASDKTAERDSLMAREGFHKNSMVAFSILTISVVVALTKGGIMLQPIAGDYVSVGFTTTLALAALLFIMTAVYRRGFAFFHRLKITNTLLLVMTLRKMDIERLDKR
jgi:uncharacterized membrane protein (DUF485 family)